MHSGKACSQVLTGAPHLAVWFTAPFSGLILGNRPVVWRNILASGPSASSVLRLRERLLLPGNGENMGVKFAPDDVCHSCYSPVCINVILTLYRTGGNDLLH